MPKCKLPEEEYVPIIALLLLDEETILPAVGMVFTPLDENEQCFVLLPSYETYDLDRIIKWNYLKDVVPEYNLCIK